MAAIFAFQPMTSLPTKQEYEKIRDCLLLPLLIEVVNKNRSQLEYDHMPLKTLFLTATDVLLDRIIADHVKIKKELKAASIKLIEQPDTKTTLNCEYICRGYQAQFSIMKDHAKSVLAVMLGKYVGEMGKEIREHLKA